MNESESNKPMNPALVPDRPEVEPTIDLDIEEFEGMEDLQALADQVAESTTDAGELEAGEPAQEVELSETRKRLDELTKASTEQADKHHRLLADFTNYRNRVSRDIALAVSLSERKLLGEFLPVVDSFERCLTSKYLSVEDFHNGVALIHKQFIEALRKVGVEGVDVKVGDPFDAAHAEALTTTTQAGLADGAVAAVYERGFMLREHLLRPARVIVNHNPGTDPVSPDGSGLA
jgi:molecular chaperone GrpE